MVDVERIGEVEVTREREERESTRGGKPVTRQLSAKCWPLDLEVSSKLQNKTLLDQKKRKSDLFHR